jgi:hypothetical protein
MNPIPILHSYNFLCCCKVFFPPLFPYMLDFIVHFVFLCSINVEVVDGFATCCSLHNFIFFFFFGGLQDSIPNKST